MIVVNREVDTWTVIKLLRDVKLPRFRLFKGETWTTYQVVGTAYELGAGILHEGTDFEVVYKGDREGTSDHEAGKVLARCEYHACGGCKTCGGQFALEARS